MLLPAGFAIGHWQDETALTGCTVILAPPSTIGGGDVRGNSPGSRELALLASEKSMQEVHAILLAGGSAFGLAAGDGVMQFLDERGVGYQTPWAKVPIVPAAVIFDLNVGSPAVRPAAASGYAACSAASAGEFRTGSVGVGIGATIGKWAGLEARMRGGFGLASARHGELIVAAAAVVNAVGDVIDSRGEVLAGARDPSGRWISAEDPLRRMRLTRGGPSQLANTTLAVVMTNARCAKVDANRIAQRGHDGLARAVKPVHTMFDGDVVFALAAGKVEAPVDVIAELGSDMVAEAIRTAVRDAAPHPSIATVKGG